VRSPVPSLEPPSGLLHLTAFTVKPLRATADNDRFNRYVFVKQ